MLLKSWKRPSPLCLLVAWIAAAAATAHGGQRGQANQVAEADRLYRQAYAASGTARTEADFTRILELCQTALELDAGATAEDYGRRLKSWTHNKRGEARASEGRQEEALVDFEESVSLDENHWRAIHNRGVSLAQLGRYDEAQADFDRTIALEPNYANAWFNRGELHFARGEFEAAVADYNEALRRERDDATTLTSRGQAHYRLGNNRQALDDLSRAVRLAPRQAAGFVYRAELLADLGRLSQASDDYRTALRVDPQFGRGYQSAAWFMATSADDRYRDPATAVRAAERAIELDGDGDYRYLDALAAAYAAVGQHERAAEIQARVVEMAADEPAEIVAPLAARLELYRAGRDYRERRR